MAARPLTSREIEAVLAEFYGIAGEAVRLPSEVDETYRVTDVTGERYVLKITSAPDMPDVLRFQTDALDHLGRVAPDMPVPKVFATRGGETLANRDFFGQRRRVRLLGWLPGAPLHTMPDTVVRMAELGRLLGLIDQHLSSFRPVVPAIDMIWDVSRADRVAGWAEMIEDSHQRGLAERAFARHAGIGPEVFRRLPRQVIHNDINPHNVIVDPERPDAIGGIIDFGDVVEAARINELAIALSYQIGKPDGTALAAALTGGYRSVISLAAEERDVLLPLVQARLAMTVAITTRRAAENPGHRDYILRNRDISLAGLERLETLRAKDWDAVLEGKTP